TTDRLIPRFGWHDEPLLAAQAWHGFLALGRQCDQALLLHLLPSFVQGFGRLDYDLKPVREEFCRFLAHVVSFADQDPIAASWLQDFVSGTDADSRRCWAREVGILLQVGGAEAAAGQCERWINAYWTWRIEKSLHPLDEEERREMAEWCLYLGTAFPHAVDMLLQSGVPDLGQTRFLWDLEGSELPAKYPAPAARLLAGILRAIGGASQTDCWPASKIVRRLASVAEAPRDSLLEACGELGRLGCAEALELRALIEGAQG
ncbi:MAG: DUF4020 domain-containing protein, partial [Chloroflexi bacterium]|nr:DUF4020 domain-containing protein [Chloroflexota bacterium]